MKVSILTPTFNRGKLLYKLYNSLINQSNKNFEWVVIDDGSTDNTKQVINKYISDNKISIKYFYKNNGGKHKAINYGMQYINSELTFIVDSDDWLTVDAIEKILFYGEKYKNNTKIACFSFHKAYSNGNISGPHYRNNEFVDNYIKYRINEHIPGESAEVVYTEKLKEFPFPEIDEEKFLSEGYLWFKMGMKYDTVYIDYTIYNFEYLQDGLTNNILRVKANNPKGCVEVYKLYFTKSVKILPKIKAMIKYIAYSKLAKYSIKKMYDDCDDKILFIIIFIFGNIYYIKNRNMR